MATSVYRVRLILLYLVLIVDFASAADYPFRPILLFILVQYVLRCACKHAQCQTPLGPSLHPEENFERAPQSVAYMVPP